jgi:aminoglycoside phosphotransferase (APT) family kinase protein
VPSRASPAEALDAACASVGLNGAGAQVLHDRANTVFKLGDQPIVARLRYAPAPSPWTNRLSVSVRVTAWLNTLGFPAVRPLDIEQPVTAHGYVVTFWDYLEATGPPWEDVDSLGHLLRALHKLPAPPLDLPVASPLGSLPEDTERCSWLTEAQRSWLRARYQELQDQYAVTAWALGCGMIHGDAYPENLIHTRDHVVLSDWDSVSYGPREQDIVPASIRYRFGHPKAEWDQFCTAYGVRPADLSGLTVLRQMRELRTLSPYIRSTERPTAQAEATRRIADLKSGTQHQPWQPLNLAT